MMRFFPFSNWANVQGHFSHDLVANDVHCANRLVPGRHMGNIAATHEHYLQAGLQLDKEMFQEDHIVATQKLAIGEYMFNEDNVG